MEVGWVLNAQRPGLDAVGVEVKFSAEVCET